jgi:hypothetical protein
VRTRNLTFLLFLSCLSIELGQLISTSDYRLDDRGSIPGRGKGFFL